MVGRLKETSSGRRSMLYRCLSFNLIQVLNCVFVHRFWWCLSIPSLDMNEEVSRCYLSPVLMTGSPLRTQQAQLGPKLSQVVPIGQPQPCIPLAPQLARGIGHTMGFVRSHHTYHIACCVLFCSICIVLEKNITNVAFELKIRSLWQQGLYSQRFPLHMSIHNTHAINPGNGWLPRPLIYKRSFCIQHECQR